jgi:hypothetical protein
LRAIAMTTKPVSPRNAPLRNPTQTPAIGLPDAHVNPTDLGCLRGVSAAVVLRGAASAQELQTYCRTRLADFEVPKLIHLVSPIPAIPKNAMGKVQRREPDSFVLLRVPNAHLLSGHFSRPAHVMRSDFRRRPHPYVGES